MLPSATITALHDNATCLWHLGQSLAQVPGELALVPLLLDHHRANYDLWHQEDEARIPSITGQQMIAVKRAIDRLNQQRNDLVEQIDLYLLRQAGDQNPAAPLNSETPGLIIDRLSILALKIFHTREESTRTSATHVHRARNLERLELLLTQRADLARCFDELLTATLAGRRRFRLYRQLKMYNDPNLNPALYTQPQP